MSAACVGTFLVAVLACGGPLPTPTHPLSSGPSPESGTNRGLDDFWWFDLSWMAEQRPGAKPDVAWEPITSGTLSMGRLDGEPIAELVRTFPDPKPFTSFRSLEPYARRIADEGVVFGYFDGARSLVEWVDPESGESDVVFESGQPIHNALVSPDRKTLYAVLLDVSARTEAGVWAFDLASGDAKGQMLLPPSRFHPENEGLIEELYLTPDGSSLVVRDCYRECRVRVIDRASGQLRTLAQKLPIGTSVSGLTNDEIIYDANCESPCHLLALDLMTGAATPVGRACSAAVVVASLAGHLIIGDGSPDSCRGSLRIVASRLEPLSESVHVFETDVADAVLVSLGDQFDALLPEGSFLVAVGSTPVGKQAQGFPLLVDAADGTVTQLVELRSR